MQPYEKLLYCYYEKGLFQVDLTKWEMLIGLREYDPRVGCYEGLDKDKCSCVNCNDQ